jgi:hypothetical protein
VTVGQRRHGWEVVLRRQPVDIINGRLEGDYTSEFEIICPHCGDDPALDHRAVSRRLQLLRGPYPLVVGVAAYEQHIEWHNGGAGSGGG